MLHYAYFIHDSKSQLCEYYSPGDPCVNLWTVVTIIFLMSEVILQINTFSCDAKLAGFSMQDLYHNIFQ